jgi:hypothetical protein
MRRAGSQAIPSSTVRRAALAAAGLLALGGAAHGQLVPPTPEKTPAPEPYTPPPAAQTPPTPPARPEPVVEAPLPSLVKRGSDGKVIRLDVLPEQAALEAMGFDEATRRRVDAGIAEYRADMDKRVIDNVGLVVQLIHQRETVDRFSTLDELQKLTFGVGPLAPGSLLERLQRSGAINPRQKRRTDQVVLEYTRAVTAEVNAEAGEGNLEKIVALGGRRVFMETSAEAVRSLERQLTRAEPNMEQIIAGLSLTPAQKSQADMLLAGTRGAMPEDRRVHVRRTNLRALFMEVLNDQQRASLLKAASPELVLPKAQPTPTGGG